MSTIRVLVVDDAVVVRRLLADVLGQEADIQVVTAPNGRVALAKLPLVNPDVVTLDVDMPEMDGLATLAALRRLHSDLPVIMFSALTERGAAATLDALSLGASDYVTKPSMAGGPAAAAQQVRTQLVPKIRHWAAPRQAAAPARIAAPRGPAAAETPADVVAIGVSTGGPNALATMLPMLPDGLGVPILIVQHMPPVFTRLLAERLAGRCRMPVAEAVAGAVVRPGQVWIAPGDHHMTVLREGATIRLCADQGPPENSCRPAADSLFRSAAAAYGAATLAVVLTGMGQDGLRGAQAVREAGGRVLVQDAATSVVWGMPGAVAHAGLANAILPLERLADEIVRCVRRDPVPAPRPAPAGVGGA